MPGQVDVTVFEFGLRKVGGYFFEGFIVHVLLIRIGTDVVGDCFEPFLFLRTTATAAPIAGFRCGGYLVVQLKGLRFLMG